MGNVYTKDIKRVAMQLYEKFKDQISTDYQANKKIVDAYVDVMSKKVRNRIAGYLTRYAKMQRTQVKNEVEEEYIEGEG
ncbi:MULTISPECIES: 30S ribosomal protein S17e [Sulfolobaceae]|uniref:Small ribosomal subunit protein eS17 n=3 Tax=Sulfurisphaera TaxID=69655 RepID=RS17E_SULTO|nr:MULTISPECIES: 30S ribosomal protein S17e [Sulfolobaceae]Q975V4.2 RecName: Full=Small ribosomal subunit protein eS17; AltName: Full=30S ribosomal protein S17e [Sulfurisphaera tokodaii str. 7]MBB5253130.1 small subunit ribosomal protein S17e [Sulfurisphaera ohwakuensis]QGR15952.1 30S ribosomal protein S17e [Sulfurisphaera ohwakuensis]QIW23152.1 30S ribosomal protein S17e [Sulfolobus sp. S-194]BAK54234.1 30S ribosomal protein S17e [Sulfurisphaera tokodaii str. 7]HII75008.1 30S ribosomal prote